MGDRFGFNDLSFTGTNCKRATRLSACGYLGHRTRACRCTPDQIARYQGRISGPLLDRIDLQIEVPALAESELVGAPAGEASAPIRERVAVARERQLARQSKPNGELEVREIDSVCRVDAAAQTALRIAIARLAWSARSYHRVLKVARTVADLAGEPGIGIAHVMEAIQYRRALSRSE